jgi:hypothetical protein
MFELLNSALTSTRNHASVPTAELSGIERFLKFLFTVHAVELDVRVNDVVLVLLLVFIHF